MGPARVAIVRDAATVAGPIGDLVSLVPVHGGADGVTTDGLLYPLTGEDLPAGSTRGISNELVQRVATVHVARGVLAAIQPGLLGTHHQERPR
jgi:thiamine pyrophosphokinase